MLGCILKFLPTTLSWLSTLDIQPLTQQETRDLGYSQTVRREDPLGARIFLLFVWALFLLPQLAEAQPMTSQFAVGQPFPNLVLPRMDNGQPGSLSQFRGRKVILQIFASW
jgi:hypothetical protein